MTTVPDVIETNRRREEEAYDLSLLRQTQVLTADSPVGRLLAVGAAAMGAEVVLTPTLSPSRSAENYLLPQGAWDSHFPAQAATRPVSSAHMAWSTSNGRSL